MAKKPVDKSKGHINKDLLTSEDKAALRAEAQKSVLADMKEDARLAYFEEQKAAFRRAQTPAEKDVQIRIDIPVFLPHIMIDGVLYFHGYTYDVPASRAIVLMEQAQRAWLHQDEIDGRKRMEAYRRPTDRTISPNMPLSAHSPHDGSAVHLEDDSDLSATAV